MANRCMDEWNMEVTYFYCMKGRKGTIVKCKLTPGQKQLHYTANTILALSKHLHGHMLTER